MSHRREGEGGQRKMVEVKPIKNPLSPTIKAAIPAGWFRREEVGRMIGRSRDTVKRWQHDGTYGPSGYMKLGKLKMWLYDEEDIANMRRIAAWKKPGPTPGDQEPGNERQR